ncbi:hypothetical protein B0H19DRAFT_1079668 [Mycena capillaripes]|nr:hypothetical protein B0H19DRAFT_1079668 [Mycena capillaripes]
MFEGPPTTFPPRYGLPNSVYHSFGWDWCCPFHIFTTFIGFVGFFWRLFIISACVTWWYYGMQLEVIGPVTRQLELRERGEMQIQALSIPKAGLLILFTFGDNPFEKLSIDAHSYLWRFPKIQKAFLATVNLGTTLEAVSIGRNSRVKLGPLLEFIRQHSSISKIDLDLNSLLASLRAGSLCTDPVPAQSHEPGGIHPLHFTRRDIRLDADTPCGAYARALAAMNPALPTHTLTLFFHSETVAPPGSSTEPNAGMEVEGRLHNIRVLEIQFFKFTAADVEPFVRWIA